MNLGNKVTRVATKDTANASDGREVEVMYISNVLYLKSLPRNLYAVLLLQQFFILRKKLDVIW